jgi:catechol 2,3-dioxygenase-like lactoylglutathione lyase family enzyme
MMSAVRLSPAVPATGATDLAPADPLTQDRGTMTPTNPVPTYGLTHVALAVRDPARSLDFYGAVLGMVAVYRDVDFIQAQTPGSRDVMVFERDFGRAGKAGGMAHFGFRLRRPDDLPRALDAVRAAGGTIREHGEFVPGEPYVFFTDPDGYEVEIWYEIPTAVDPDGPSAPAPIV